MVGYCSKHKIAWRDDDVRDEQFACEACEQADVSLFEQLDEIAATLDGPEEAREFVEEMAEELRSWHLTEAETSRVIKTILDRIESGKTPGSQARRLVRNAVRRR